MKKKFIKMFALATILGCGLGVVTSCGSNIDSTPSTEEVDDINLTLSEENLSININQTKTLTANTNNNNLYLFTWSSSDKEIATVSKGTITALKPGSVDITVSVKKKGSAKVLATKTCKVVVVNKSLTLDKTEMTISMSEGKTGVITATITDDAPITWTSSDETIATVDGGVVTAIKAGSVTITAKSGDLEATCAVNIYKNFFSLNATEIIEVGESKKLEVNGELSADAKYSTSDDSIVSIENGEVVGLKNGMATITLRSEEDNIVSTCVVIVKGKGEEKAELLTGKKAETVTNPGNWYYLLESDSVTVSEIPSIDNGLITANVTHVGKEDGTISGPNMFYLRYQPDSVGDYIYSVKLYLYSSENSLISINGGADTEYSKGLTIIPTEFTSNLSSPYQIKIKAAANYYIIPVIEKIGEVEKMRLSESKLELDLNGKKEATLTATVPGNDNPEITWMSSDETVAIVNGGVVTALKEGTTKITAICGSESAECDVTVVNSEANKLQISNEVLELNVSTNKTYTLTATKPGVDNLEVVWHSSDETVATVDGGVVTALKKGVCDITATYNGETVTCKLTVIDDNVIDLKSGNKQAAIDNAGNWNYFADGKSSVSATPTYNQKGNEINIDVSKVATADKKYVYLRYQPTESGEYKVTLTINYVGEGVANIEISGGSATAVTSDLENGENKIEFTFTVDSKNPFQIKFKSEGNFVITPVFEKIIK